ncbi:spliceosome-associated protein 130 A [Tanacetum coccineum]
MHLYNLTLQKPTGTFSSSGSQELVVARGKLLELLRLDKHGTMQTILSVDVFCAIRSLANLTSQRQKDYIVVGSDSGLISILAYNEHDNVFEHIHKETVGKSGCRRIVPGQYLALDPKGRALMIDACEKQKLVYVLNRDSAANFTISSPLEAHKSCTVTYSIVGVDCGWDNPVFAALESDYSEPDQGKHLTFYELDLGLNNVYRKLSQRVDDGANMLVAVPGGGDGLSGVLVCTENFVIYKNQDPVTSEFGNHALYQFQAIRTNPDVESSSSTSMETDEGFQPVLFKPKGLKNLVRIDQMESLMPIMGMKVVNLFEEETPQIFTLCGRGPRSSLRILRPGLAISELAVSQLPGVPSAVWTVKKNINDEFDAYIVVSFANATLVLSIGGETVEEEDTGDMHQGVMGRIAELVWKASTHREIFIVHAFGKKTTVPTQQEDPYMTGITYFVSSNSPKMKPFSIENVILVNLLSMATGTTVACNFVILTRKDLSQAIHFLSSLGHSVTTAMASCFDQSLHLMRDASNNTIIWPNLEAGASSSPQMEVDEDSAARKRVHRGHH